MNDDVGSQDEHVVPVIEEESASENRSRAIEPQRPQAEHALFVVLGMMLTVIVFLRGLGFI